MAKRRNTGPGISFFAFQDIITAVVGIFILITLILVLELAQRVETASTAPTEDIQPIVETIATLRQQIEQIESELTERFQATNRSSDVNAFNIEDKVEQLKQQNVSLESQIETSDAKTNQLAAENTIANAETARLSEQSAQLASQRNQIQEQTKKAEQIQEQANVLLGDESTIYRDEIEAGRYLTLITLGSGRIEIRDALTRSAKVFRGPKRLSQLKKWFSTTPMSHRHLLVLVEPDGASDFQTVEQLSTSNKASYGFTVVGRNHAVRLSYELEITP
ncbi:hypothetical protein Pla52o_06300 [Novipirellula galeiformis]|uniref:Chromosome partition protein Smc n=1 Tax=Novipirellula galeiformis TaxID=2528004 RepID=A0A5C6CSC3_9BACT|nr:hypothetical protein [Novipirellula galeiformis]TWU26775.1 hypothetical protein Pla52o_06300 [Novipirellula galeiformis]